MRNERATELIRGAAALLGRGLRGSVEKEKRRKAESGNGVARR
jgi:hypothetical protein